MALSEGLDVSDDGKAIPHFLVELTASAAIIDTEGRIVGDNVTDATLQFGWRADDMPEGASDDAITGALGTVVGLATTIVQLAMTTNKWVYMGSVAEPDLGRGEVVRISSIERSIVMPAGVSPEGRA